MGSRRKSRRRVGALLKDKREDVHFVTRAGVVWEDGAAKSRFDVESLESDCEASLTRLQSDWIDVWLLHDPPEEVLLDKKTYELANRLKAEGRIKAFGVTTARVDVARAAMSEGIDAVCMPLHFLHSDDHIDLEDDIRDSGCGVLARSPLCHGLLAGRWTEYRRFADDDHRRDRWSHAALMTRVRTAAQLRYFVHGDVTNLAAAALRYVLAQKGVTCAVLGARRASQITIAATMAGEAPYLPQEDLDRLGQVLAAAGA